MATETEPIPNMDVGNSERDAGKSKKREGLWKPNTELPPNRIYEIAICESAMFWMSRSCHLASSTEGVGQNAW